MKTRYFIILIAILSISFSSCNLNSSSNYTPVITFLSYPKDQNKDSLQIYYTDEGGILLLDTISVGDTITFKMGFSGFTNNLKTLYINQSSDSVTRIILPPKSDMDSIFLSTSDYAKGKFYMNGTDTYLYFPFRYVALKKSKEAKITFTILSDAVFEDSYGSNSTTITLKTPIRE